MELPASVLAARYGIDERSAGVLAEFGFDADVFDALRSQLRAPPHDDGATINHLAADGLRAAEPTDLVRLAEPGTAEHSRLAEVGEAAIAAGQVGCLVLAGGMATRFGGGTKALANVTGDASFIDLKVTQFELAASGHSQLLPVWLMTSFATHASLREWVAARAASMPDSSLAIECVPQFVSMRLQPDGELVCTPNAHGDGDAPDGDTHDGKPALAPCVPSLYAPGHGDAPWAMERSGALERFRSGGGRYIALSNVDNLGATLDPAVIGAHIAGGNPLTCEVAEGSDVGGAPWWVNGHLQIVEAFRLPPGREPTEAGCINTNSMVIDVDVMAARSPLTFFRVHKQVNGDTVVQFERLIGQLSQHTPTTMLAVPRDGPAGRFQPVKDPDELARRRPDIEATLKAKGVLGNRVAPLT